MTAEEFRDTIAELNLGLREASRMLDTDIRNMRRWASGTKDIPEDLATALRAVRAAVLTYVEAKAARHPYQADS